MRLNRDRGTSLVVAGMLLAVACGGDSSGPVTPKTLVLISGDGQVGGLGATLAQPLILVVIGSDGNPFSNATVAWTVTTGTATVSPTSSTSDAVGRASTTVTLGASPGLVTVTATVTGVSPLSFTAMPVAPGSLAIAAGDGQTGPSGGALPLPLRVTLLGTNSAPYAGATVLWAVASGAATLTPSTSVTDAAGTAATTVQLGGAAGPVSITATVTGVPAVTFAATAVPPCQFVAPYTLGDTAVGSLSGNDCAVFLGASYYYDYFGLTLPNQQSFTVGQSSTAFDTWLELYKATGTFLAVNDDEGLQTTNSRLNAIMAGGNYVIAASSYDPVTTGAYTVTSGARPATVAGCQSVFATRAITLGETIMTTDCKDSSAAGVFYSDRLVIALDSGDTFEARMQSGTVDPFLFLYEFLRDSIVAFNNDSAPGNPTAFLTYIVDSAGFFLLDIGTAAASQSGSYTLTIAGPAAATVTVSGGATVAPWLRLPAFGPAERWPKSAGERLRHAGSALWTPDRRR